MYIVRKWYNGVIIAKFQMYNSVMIAKSFRVTMVL